MADLGGFLGAAGVGSAIGQAVVQLELDTKKYQAELAAAEGKTVAGTKSMSSGLAAFGGVAKAGMTAAGVAVVAFGAHAISAASDLGEAVNKSNVIFGNNAKAVEAWAETGADAFGLSKTAALDAAAGFGAMLETAGIATGDLDDMSKSMVQLAGDMASFNNIDPTEALEKLRSGLAGEAEPLRRFGVFLSEAAVQQEAYASGIAKTGEELTEAQKVQARYNIIFEQTTKQQGDFARTADSLPNQLRTMRAEFENISAEVGTSLLPAMTDLLGTIKALMPVIGFLGEHIIELTAILVGLKLATSGATTGFKGFFTALGPGIAIAAGAIVVGKELNETFYGTDKTVEELASTLSNQLQPALDAGIISYTQYTAAAAAARDPSMETAEALLEVERALALEAAAIAEETAMKQGSKAAADSYVQAQQNTAMATDEATKSIKRFAKMSEEELTEFQAAAEESFDSVIFDLDNMAHKADVTRREFIRAHEAMEDRARELSRAMKELRGEKWVNDEYIAFLSEQGPEWLIGFTKLTKEQQREAQQAWKDSTKETDNAKMSFDNILEALGKIGGGTSKHTVKIHYEYVGFDPSKPGMTGSNNTPSELGGG